MSDLSRRSMLSGSLKAALAGAGGLLLPWQGGGALALPDTGRIGGVPVSTVPLPVSAETLMLRAITERQYEINEMPHTTHAQHEVRNRLWREAAWEYRRTAEVILQRPVQSWSQAVEIAEICWLHYPKVWVTPPGWEQSGRRGVLMLENQPVDRWALLSLQGAGARRGYRPDEPAPPHLEPMPHLIEAVLALGGGLRREPRFAPDVQTLKRVGNPYEILKWKGEDGHEVPWVA